MGIFHRTRSGVWEEPGKMESKINLTTVKPINYKVTAALINQVPLPSPGTRQSASIVG